MPKVPYPYKVNGKLVTENGSLIPICSLLNRSLLPSLTVLMGILGDLFAAFDFMPAFSVYFDKSLKYNLFHVLLMSFYTMGLNPFWINQIFKLFWFKLNFVFLLQGDIFQIFLEYFAILSLKSLIFISYHFDKISNQIIDANLNQFQYWQNGVTHKLHGQDEVGRWSKMAILSMLRLKDVHIKRGHQKRTKHCPRL